VRQGAGCTPPCTCPAGFGRWNPVQSWLLEYIPTRPKNVATGSGGFSTSELTGSAVAILSHARTVDELLGEQALVPQAQLARRLDDRLLPVTSWRHAPCEIGGREMIVAEGWR
jgi:hypothetical protein